VARSYIAVVGHGPDLLREDGAASLLVGLGASVRTMDLWDEPARIAPRASESLSAIVIEGLDRPDLAAAVLRALRREAELAQAPAIVAVTAARVGQLDPEYGFDDFVLSPYLPPELYARVRHVEWRKSEFQNEERIKIGELMIDKSGHDVRVAGQSVALTAREYALLVYLCEHRGRVVSRGEALERVWGHDYEGGHRTVDIHVRRLRSKLGRDLPLCTLRGAGYKLEVGEVEG
jgi:DNA-binding response OmpR family regulator